ncbi:thiamine-phosphate kinase [Helicobacter sp. 13S00477-4]|uniref:thiamine-phosphate kinase n=1 Tax=Helicobacter sp. 13S00477-4 TaxID=1905759 RepID=UPI000BA5C625|nr:thiamine-phosphate kinase [Helicobacter sp. 13S00477-4]PAF52127.1 hypothetical protein BKH44_04450 [Helicobacter sp. 13S00477-4]
MDKESYFIQKLIQSGITQGIGDDGVVFSKNTTLLFKNKLCIFDDIQTPIYAMDMFWEGVHFKKNWLRAKEIAYKAFLINISDILAMNAVPKYAILGISLPQDVSKQFINELISGMVQACKEYGIKIIGGDTIGGADIGLAISMIGDGKNKVLFRKGAKIGDLILHTGRLGGSYRELLRLQRGMKGNRKNRFYNPLLRGSFIRRIFNFVHLGIDISDGVYTELNRLCKLNKLCFKLDTLSRDYRSGEEYEMLFCISKKDYLKILRLGRVYRIPIKVIGKVVRGKNLYKTNSWH